MDIARYIGLFLLKNNFCYIHGLGNLELRKRPAVQEGESLRASQYEVVLTPKGSIDDNLANFIAVNEQISISKASNALRDFSIQARAELQAGREVVLPAIGKFVEVSGRIHFVMDPHFQYVPPSIPVVARRIIEEEKKKTAAPVQESSARTTVNWGKIIIWVLILGIVVSGVVFGIRFISEQQQAASAADTVQELVPQIPVEEPQPYVQDSVPAPDTLAPQPAAPVTAGPLQVVLNEYDNLARAQKREKQLISFGNQVSLVTRDSITFSIVLPVTSPVADTAHLLDSLRRHFNPKGEVSIYR